MKSNSSPRVPSSATCSRRAFLHHTAALAGTAAAGFPALLHAAGPPPIQGFEPAAPDPNASAGWQPVSDRRIRVGLVGYGVCQFGAAFGFQDHPNVRVLAVSDLLPDRCAALAKACRCAKTYPSLEELVEGQETQLPDTRRPPLPPGLAAGGHGGSHGHLTHEFVSAQLQQRQPLVDITMALNLTASGIVAHQSALKGGEWLKIPQYNG